VLRFFTENAIRVLRWELLLNEVWGYNAYPTTRTVDNHMLKLRRKLELDPANPKHILTIYGARVQVCTVTLNPVPPESRNRSCR
jgi:DNA-binding response OmpR family regulator